MAIISTRAPFLGGERFFTQACSDILLRQILAYLSPRAVHASLGAVSQHFCERFSRIATGPRAGLLITHPSLPHCFEEALESVQQVENVVSPGVEMTYFVRDLVVIVGKKAVFPAFLNTEHIAHNFAQFYAYLPESARSFRANHRAIYGCGFDLEAQSKIARYLASRGFTCVRGKAAGEGGNIRQFHDLSGQRFAAVGMHTIAVTLFAMYQRQEVIVPPARPKEPSSYAFLLARNQVIYEQLIQENTTTTLLQGSTYVPLLNAPVTAMERNIYREEAWIWEDRIGTAKAWLAHDLELPLHRILFLHQSRFHLDMDCFATPTTLFLQDPHLCIQGLKKIRRKFDGSVSPQGLTEAEMVDYRQGNFTKLSKANFRKIVRQFQRQASIERADFTPYLLENAALIRSRGLRVGFVPGAYEDTIDDNKKPVWLNFMNGCALGRAFVTNGADLIFKPFQDFFWKTVLNYDPTLRVGFARLHEESFLDLDGGVHCMTLELPFTR